MKKSTRNPQETQRKILTAALKEFSENGFHGARIDRIVKMAEVNKRMIYHYFKDKEGLFRALIEIELDKIKKIEDSQPIDSLYDQVTHWLTNMDKTKDYYRLSLSASSLINSKEITLNNEHENNFTNSIKVYKELLKNTKINPEYFLLAMIGITALPVILPAMTNYITGETHDSKKFKEEYSKVLKYLLKNNLSNIEINS